MEFLGVLMVMLGAAAAVVGAGALAGGAWALIVLAVLAMAGGVVTVRAAALSPDVDAKDGEVE